MSAMYSFRMRVPRAAAVAGAGLGLVSLILLGFAGAGLIAPAWAIAAFLALVAGVGLAVRLVASDVALIERQAVAIAQNPSDSLSLPVESTIVGRRGTQALLRLNRSWRRRHDRLHAELEALQSIFEALHDPLLVIDANRRVVRANQAARDLFGDRVSGRDLAATLRNPGVLDAVDAVLEGAGSRSLEFSIPVPVEMTFEVRVQPFRVSPPHGETDEPIDEISTIILTLHEITAVKRSEQMRADFVANASHELRTPLSALLGFIETLRGPAREDADARDRFLSIMADQAQRMSRLVNDLLSLSRIELDERRPPTGQVDVVLLAQTAIDALELRARSRGVRLKIQAEDDIPMIPGDGDQIVQVFQNLLDNAIKYTREDTDVTISVSIVDGMPTGSSQSTMGGALAVASVPSPRLKSASRLVAVAVADQGEGIPRTHLPRLTERFYRVDPARSRQLGGTGLGLAIVKHIVNRHRGRLTIESTVGRGSIFTVYLPGPSQEDPLTQPQRTDLLAQIEDPRGD